METLRDGKTGGAPQRPRLKCSHPGCRASYTREWKLKEHKTVHTGERPCRCTAAGCGLTFTRSSHLSRHMLQHKGAKQYRCKFAPCTKSFFNPSKLNRHVGCAHAEKKKFFKCSKAKCPASFKKRSLLKLHLMQHSVPAAFKCTKSGCSATLASRVARKAHERKHAGYRCPQADCQALQPTWGKLQKHLAKHATAPVTWQCPMCKKDFKKAAALRRHSWIHASHKPVLVCPREDCQAYFSTTFNLQHHIRKVHLELLKYKCPFPDCPRMFAMRESMNRHLLHHDPTAATSKKRQRAKKLWQKRLNRNHQPLVEENLRHLFALRMRISRRAKVETNLAGLFNERKIPHYVDPEVNLRGLFGIKPSRPVQVVPDIVVPAVAPVVAPAVALIKG